MIVLDADVLIAVFEARDARHDEAKRILVDAVDADHELASSTITLAEVLVGPARAGALPAATTGLAALKVREIALPDDAAVRLAQLRSQTGLRLPDCCVLLAAMATNAAGIATFDARLRRAAAELGLDLD